MTKTDQYDVWHQERAHVELFTTRLQYPWHRTVARLLPDLHGKKVLEVGCGRGDFSIWLASEYPKAEVVSVDFSDSAISIARAKAFAVGSNVNFKVDNACSLAFDAGSFDYVISCECLEHVESPSQMAGEINRVLRVGGRFIITTENYLNSMILAWFKSWLTRTPFDSGSGIQPRENFFLYWRVKRILEANGLFVDHMESNHFQWLLLPRTDPAKLATEDVSNKLAKRMLRPFGRHFTFSGFSMS